MEAKKFNIDQELSNKDFLKFLASHADSESFNMSDEAKLKERFDVFNFKEKVKTELKDLYRNQIKEQLGVELGDADLNSMDVYLDKQALENPEKIILLEQSLASFVETPKKIAELENELSGLGKRNDLAISYREKVIKAKKLEEMKGAYDWSTIGKHGINILSRGYFFEDAKKKRDLAKEFSDSNQVINERERSDMFIATTEEYLQINIELKKVKDLEAKKHQHEKSLKVLRGSVLELAGEIGGIKEVIQARATSILKELTNKESTLESLDEAVKKMRDFSAASEKSQFKVDIFEDKAGQISLTETINQKTDAKVVRAIKDAVENNGLNTGSFKELSDTIEKLITRENIGNKTGVAIKDFVRTILTEESAKLTGADTDSKAKKIMIARLLVKTI